MRRPSRLWRSLNAEQPLFKLWSEDTFGPFLDHDIEGLKIHRGSTSPAYGMTTDTLEVNMARWLDVHTGKRVHVSLSEYGETLISQRLGISPAAIRHRFFGRIGRMSINDVKPGRQHATMYASTWHAQLTNTRVTMTLPADSPVRDGIAQVSAPAGVGLSWIPPVTTPAPPESYGYLHESMTFESFEDGMRSLVADLGYYWFTQRDGTVTVLPPGHLWTRAQQQMGTALPLTRSQVLSPSTWDQPAEVAAGTHSVTFRNENGQAILNSFGTDVDNPNMRRVEYDMTHVEWRVDYSHPRAVARIGFMRERNFGYSIPTLTIDLLQLIRSPRESDRAQAAQLLRLQTGDAIFLSGDWVESVAGIQFVTGMTETITADRWELNLSVHTSPAMVAEISPTIAPRVWESATYAWDTETRTWNAA